MNSGIDPKYATGQPAMKGKIEINGRESHPGPLELHIDKLPFPAREDGLNEPPMSLTVQLDIGTKTIRIIRKDTPETQHVSTLGVLEMHLADDNHIYYEGYNGEEYLMVKPNAEKLSESILSVFRAHPTICGTR